MRGNHAQTMTFIRCTSTWMDSLNFCETVTWLCDAVIIPACLYQLVSMSTVPHLHKDTRLCNPAL